VVLDSIADSRSTRDVTWIFTDQQSSSKNGTRAATDYLAAARKCGSPFVSIILHCGLDENIRRLTNCSRGGTNTKLTDESILRNIRDNEDIYRFGGELELEVDITAKSPDAAAQEIERFLSTA
jgi:hypothetical protein